MQKYKQQPQGETAKTEPSEKSGGQSDLDLDIPYEKIGSLVEMGGVLVPGEGRGTTEVLRDMAKGTLELKPECGGRKHAKKSARVLAKRWSTLARGLPEPLVRTSLLGGIVAEWRTGDTVSLEFSRKLKRAWIDVSSPQGDWGMEVKLKRGGWRKLGKRLRKIVREK